MDSTFRKNIILGFFVLLGLSLFIAGIFLIGAKNEMFRKTFPITAKFANTNGLKEGSNVRYNGVKVGIVKTVTLINDTLVQVNMQIEESKRKFILKNAIASIASDGLMGDKLINITTGQADAPQVQNNDVLAVRNPLITDQVLQTLSQSNDNIREITENLKTLTADINSKNGPVQLLYKDTLMAKNLKQSFSNLDGITEKVLKASSSLQQVTSQIQNGNGVLNEIINDTTLANNLSYTLGTLKKTVDKLNIVSRDLSLTVQRANSGNGAINMLLTDTAFSADIQKSMQNIKSASKGLDENMEALKHNFLMRGYFRKQAKKNKK